MNSKMFINLLTKFKPSVIRIIQPSACFANIAPYKVANTDDDSTFVVWHPQSEFPYEFTKPLPEIKGEGDSVLKTQLTPQLREIFNKKTPDQARAELMEITHTTKHRWFPRARDKKAKKTPMDRKYL